MGETWLEILDDAGVARHREELKLELEKLPDIWYPFLTIDEVLRRVDEALYQVWIGGRDGRLLMWGMTEVTDYPAGKCVRVIWASGKSEGFDFYADWVDSLEKLAKVSGAKYIEVGGRPGWERIYKHHGYKLTSITLLKELDHA